MDGLTPAQRVLADLGHRRWATIAGLALGLGLSRRDVEAAIEELRLGGAPIIGGSEGVKLTDNPTELEAYIAGRRMRTAQIHRGTMRLRSTLRRMKYGDQPTLWESAA